MKRASEATHVNTAAVLKGELVLPDDSRCHGCDGRGFIFDPDGGDAFDEYGYEMLRTEVCPRCNGLGIEPTKTE